MRTYWRDSQVGKVDRIARAGRREVHLRSGVAVGGVGRSAPPCPGRRGRRRDRSPRRRRPPGRRHPAGRRRLGRPRWLPAAATTTTPLARASSIAASIAALSSGPPRLRLMTRAPRATAQAIPSATAESQMSPSSFMTLIGITTTPGATPATPEPVVRRRCDDPGDVRAVAVLVGRVAVAVAEVDAEDEAAGEVGVGEVDAGVEDGDDDLGPAARERPGGAGPDDVGRPLVAPVGVVGGRDRRWGRRRGAARAWATAWARASATARRSARVSGPRRARGGPGPGRLHARERVQRRAHARQAGRARDRPPARRPPARGRRGARAVVAAPGSAVPGPVVAVAPPSGRRRSLRRRRPPGATYWAVRSSGFHATRTSPREAAAASTGSGPTPGRRVTRRLVGRLRSGPSPSATSSASGDGALVPGAPRSWLPAAGAATPRRARRSQRETEERGHEGMHERRMPRPP